MQFEKWYDLDLDKGHSLNVDLGPVLFTEDSNPLKLGVMLYRGNQSVSVSGTVSGRVIIPDGSTIEPLTAGYDTNRAWVIIPQTALALQGKIEIFLRISDSSAGAVALYATATVHRSETDTIYVPGEPLPDVDELRAIAADCEEALEEMEQYDEKISTFSDRTAGIFESTDNLWPTENVFSDTKRILLPLGQSFPAGTYTVAFELITTDRDARYGKLEVHKGSGDSYPSSGRLVNNLYFYHNTRTAVTFTVNEAFTRFRIFASDTDANSDGDPITVRNFQLTSGTQTSPYKPHSVFNYDPTEGEITVYTDFQPGYINTGTTSPVDLEAALTADSDASHMIIPCEAGDEFLFECYGRTNSDLRTFMFLDSSYNILMRSYTASASVTPIIPFDPRETYIAPQGAAYLVVNHAINRAYGYTPKVYLLSKNKLHNYLATYQYGTLPFYPKQEWKTKVIAAYQSMVAILDNGIARLSRDCGKTWNTGVDISAVGELSAAYLYANGCLGFFTQRKAYYTDNWSTYSEAALYEANGSTFTAETDTIFEMSKTHAERKFYNGADILMFTNYHTVDTVRSLIWCSFDQGHSYKIIFEFGSRSTPTPSGSWQVRHCHDVFYFEPEDVYIIPTGDQNSGNENAVHVLELDAANQTCTVTRVGEGRAYKWSNLAAWNQEIYYTQDNTPGSVWKFKYEDIGDLTKHELVMDGTYNDPTSLVIGNRGDIFVTCSTSRNTGSETVPSPFTADETPRMCFYSSDRKSFKSVFVPTHFLTGIHQILNNMTPVMSDGSVFVKSYGTSHLPSFCVSDFVKCMANPNGFMPKL